MDVSGKIAFRPAASPDIQRMWEIDQVCFDPGIAYAVDVFYFHMLVHRDPAFVAEENGRIIGFVMTAMEKRDEGLIVTIDLLPEWRAKGIGSRLIALAEEALIKRGAQKVVLQTAVENHPAIAFYQKHGYRNMKTLKHYYGRGKPAFQFEKTLP
ncbi:MAG: GNAT family N-acetyltransferase [Nitrospinae bacterium]|nr:GNAT family N-acetyltransferase [Nitrospinota bacterium]